MFTEQCQSHVNTTLCFCQIRADGRVRYLDLAVRCSCGIFFLISISFFCKGNGFSTSLKNRLSFIIYAFIQLRLNFVGSDKDK